MVNYEPELMYALDSKSEYADWKNVYNVSGSDVLYCPICLGRVKLWNGQDPNKTYQKQRCFHHIDGMCSQESRIHFAYKTWLLKQGSKFKVGETIYEVTNSEIEKTFHTKFGIYRPDITVETTEGKSFYIEIADTNKKTNDYIEKWDELGCDVLELDVNEQLIKATIAGIPEFNIIYSSSTGECYIKHYTRQDYDDLITERKIYWKRKDLIKYKIQWERLDWFWRKLQDFYSGNSKIDILIDAFRQMDSEDQRFICKRMRGKHSSLKYELENNYTDKKDIEKAHLQHISTTIKKLNQEFGYSSSNPLDSTYLFRKDKHVIFKDSPIWENRSHLYIYNYITEEDVYNYFHPIMEEYYKEHTVPLLESIQKKKICFEENENYINNYFIPKFKKIQKQINRCSNTCWYVKSSVTVYGYTHEFKIIIKFLNCFEEHIYLNFNEKSQNNIDIKNLMSSKMNNMIAKAKEGLNSNIRIMEER